MPGRPNPPRPAWLLSRGTPLRTETYETARLRHAGYDIYFVEGEWRSWAAGKPPADDPDRTVRVRTAGSQAWITIKGRTVGAVRSEFEYPIPLNDADALLILCERPLLEKRRYHFEHDGRVWEIDEFLGENTGLVVAEIELDEPDSEVSLPSWTGMEVTHDPRYFNSSLTMIPFTTWE